MATDKKRDSKPTTPIANKGESMHAAREAAEAAKPAPAPEPVTVTVAADGSELPKVKADRDNSHLKFRNNTLSKLAHLREVFPGLAAQIDQIVKSVETMDDNYSPAPRLRSLTVGELVKLPTYASVIKSIGKDPEGRYPVASIERHYVKVAVGECTLTVPKTEIVQ